MESTPEATVPPDLRTAIDLLFAEIEARYGWPLTKPPARLTIRYHRDGTMRLHGELEEHVFDAAP